MTNCTFEDIKGLLSKSIHEYGFESELRLCFHDNPNEYMIIIYDDHCSFQRCGAPEEISGEYNFESLDELYKALQIDGIVLERDWEKVCPTRSGGGGGGGGPAPPPPKST